jgi:hypothetical protein
MRNEEKIRDLLFITNKCGICYVRCTTMHNARNCKVAVDVSLQLQLLREYSHATFLLITAIIINYKFEEGCELVSMRRQIIRYSYFTLFFPQLCDIPVNKNKFNFFLFLFISISYVRIYLHTYFM